MDCRILLTGAGGQLGTNLFYNLNKLFNVYSTSLTYNENSNVKKLDIKKTVIR